MENLSNENLVGLFQHGDHDALLRLWEQVRLLVLKYAGRWAVYGGNGVEIDDLMQTGFIAVLRAAETYDSSSGAKFSTFLVPVIKTEFTAATGRRTKKQQMDPLQAATSLDAPLTTDDEDFSLADTLEDPAAAEAFEAVDEADRLERLRSILEESIDRVLTQAQQRAIRRRYYQQKTLPPGDEYRNCKTALIRLRHPAVSGQLRAYL